jgi:hypothetical protein
MVFVLLFGRFWTKFRAVVENTMERPEIEKALERLTPFQFENLKRGQGR